MDLQSSLSTTHLCQQLEKSTRWCLDRGRHMFKGEMIWDKERNFNAGRQYNKSEISYWVGKKMCGILCIHEEIIDHKWWVIISRHILFDRINCTRAIHLYITLQNTKKNNLWMLYTKGNYNFPIHIRSS